MQKLREIIVPGFLITVQRTAMVAEAAHVMASRNVGIVAVLEDDRLVGLFSERDLLRRVVDHRLNPNETVIGDVMTHDLIVADADEDYQSAMGKMDQANIRHLPVVSDGRLLSMLSIRDLMRLEIHQRSEELRYLHEYLYQIAPNAPRG